MHIPKILKPFLKLTADERTPTDIELDNDIEYVMVLMHNMWPTLKKIIWNKTIRFFKYRWKFVFSRMLVFSLIMVLTYYAIIKVMSVQIIRAGQPMPTVKQTCYVYKSNSTMTMKNFLLQIAYGESRYINTANRPGSQYLGLYQIGTNERRIAGYGDISPDVFMNHPEIQDMCMINLLKYNRNIMKSYIAKYSGKIVDGILVTESGILALCQLGCGATMNYLDRGIIPVQDANGNKPRNLLMLGGYVLNLDNIKYATHGYFNFVVFQLRREAVR